MTLISGSGNTSVQFSTIGPVVGTDGNPLVYPHNSVQYGLLNAWWNTQLPQQNPLTSVITYVPLPLPAALPSKCSASSTPTTLGQTLTITDASNFVLETHVVELVNLTPGGNQVPLWRSSTFQGGKYTVPFTLTPSGFQVSDQWSLTIPGRVDWGL